MNYKTVFDLPNLANLVDSFPQPFPAKITNESEYSVPNILHFLWIESSLPEKYMRNVVAFSAMNPKYRVILWIDRDVPFDLLPMLVGVEVRNIRELNLPLLPLMSKLATRIDYIRYEIVHEFGGIYSDIDTVPLTPFDETLESAFVSYGDTNIQNSFFGFPPKSNFVSCLLKAIEQYATMSNHERGDTFHGKFTGGDFLGACLWASQDNQIRCISELLTGHAPVWRNVSDRAYCRHMYEFNWKDPADPKGKN
jgi:mannosyltransferase OCH1-like enzyme